MLFGCHSHPFFKGLYCIGCAYIAQHYIRFLCTSHHFSLVVGPVRSSTNSVLWGSTQSCCNHGTGNYSITRALTVQPDTHSLLSRGSAHTGEGSCPRTCTVPHHGSRDSYPRPLKSKSQAQSQDRAMIRFHSHFTEKFRWGWGTPLF